MRKSNVTVEAEREIGRCYAIAFEDGTVVHRGCRQSLETRKGKEADSPLELG